MNAQTLLCLRRGGRFQNGKTSGGDRVQSSHSSSAETPSAALNSACSASLVTDSGRRVERARLSRAVLRTAIPRLQQVNAPRSVTVLKELRRELSHRQRSEYARSALAELEPALARFNTSPT